MLNYCLDFPGCHIWQPGLFFIAATADLEKIFSFVESNRFILLSTFGIMLIFNCLTPLISDDYSYLLRFPTHEPVGSFQPCIRHSKSVDARFLCLLAIGSKLHLAKLILKSVLFILTLVFMVPTVNPIYAWIKKTG